MANKRKFLLALRDGINKLSGKQALIDEYEKVTDIITRHIDKMDAGKAKDELLHAFDELNEVGYTSGKKGGMYVEGFDQYTSNKKVLKQKIELNKQIMQRFGIKR